MRIAADVRGEEGKNARGAGDSVIAVSQMFLHRFASSIGPSIQRYTHIYTHAHGGAQRARIVPRILLSSQSQIGVGLKCKTKRATSPSDNGRPAGVRSHDAPRTPSNSFNLLQGRRHRSRLPSISLLSDIPIARRVWQSDLVTETREKDKTKNAQLTSRATFRCDTFGI